MKYRLIDKIPEDQRNWLKQSAKRILRHEAKVILRKYHPKIVAISGSVGKTLTKEAIYISLSKKFHVRKSEKSFTAELGVPLAIIGSPYGTDTIYDWIRNILHGLRIIVFKAKYPEWIILEIDNDKSGDLAAVAKLAKPDILVLTEIGSIPAHIENFGSLGSFMHEQRNFINAVKQGGVIIYNSDDSQVCTLLDDCPVRSVACGIGNGTVRGGGSEISYLPETGEVAGMRFNIDFGGQSHAVSITGSIGVQNEYAFLLAFAVGIELKLSPKEIISQLSRYSVLPGRMRILQGIKNTTLIDDSYNSSPAALEKALLTFKNIQSKGRKIAVIGDMLELGRYSASEHRNIAAELKTSAAYILTVGFRAKKIAEELSHTAQGKKHVESFDNSEAAGKYLQNFLKAGDVVLVKGSQAMRMEKTVEEVMLNPKDKKKLLVRQEKRWQDR